MKKVIQRKFPGLMSSDTNLTEGLTDLTAYIVAFVTSACVLRQLGTVVFRQLNRAAENVSAQSAVVNGTGLF